MLNKINPNYLTAFGLTLVPFMVTAQQMGGIGGLAICLLLLLFREGTDIADGQLARRTNHITVFGQLFDPMVDSLSRGALFMGFLASGWMPLWMALIIFARDIGVWFVRALAASHGIVMAARPSGKYIKAVPQATAQIATVHGYLLVECKVNVPVEEVSWWLLFVATACTATTAFDYIYAGFSQIKTKTGRIF